MATMAASFALKEDVAGKTFSKSEEPKVINIKKMPRIKPRSPILFMIKALLAAAEYSLFFHQKPISR
jgi:hypothetical protein